MTTAEMMVLPLVPGDLLASFAAETGWMVHRMDEFLESRENAGVVVERVALVETPIGGVSISYLESGSDRSPDFAKTVRESPSLFDQDMLNRGRVLHGLTPEQQRTTRRPVEAAIYHRVEVSPRPRWNSFGAQLDPSRAKDWLEFARQVNEDRRAEFEAFNAKNGFNVVCAGLYERDFGTLACFYLEGTDRVDSFPKAISQSGEFESWFAEQFQNLHGVDIRKGVPSPTIGVPWDWVAGESTENVTPIYNEVRAYFAKK